MFTSLNKGYEPRPFDILDDNTHAVGIRSRLLKDCGSLRWTFGAELFLDRYEYKNYENLYADYPIGTGSVKGDLLSHFNENRRYANIFAETNYDLSKKTLLSLGLNYNTTSYKVKDYMVSNQDVIKSGQYRFRGMLSPKVGISHKIFNKLTIYTNVAHGFSPPTTSETLLPDGKINTDIKPEHGWNTEIGLRARAIKENLYFKLALFRMGVRDMLVARRTAEDEFIGVNAGKTIHRGMEWGITYRIIHNKKWTLNSYLNGSFNDFYFADFIDDGNNYSGNKLTGVPSEIINAGIDFNTISGFYGNINYNYTGSFPMNDANSLFTDAYRLVNMKLGFAKEFSNKLKMDVSMGLNNVFNEKYASQILINAIGFGSSQPRYYYPGNPLNYYFGVMLGYQFDKN